MAINLSPWCPLSCDFYIWHTSIKHAFYHVRLLNWPILRRLQVRLQQIWGELNCNCWNIITPFDWPFAKIHEIDILSQHVYKTNNVINGLKFIFKAERNTLKPSRQDFYTKNHIKIIAFRVNILLPFKITNLARQRSQTCMLNNSIPLSSDHERILLITIGAGPILTTWQNCHLI